MPNGDPRNESDARRRRREPSELEAPAISRPGRLWFGLLGGAVAWFAYFVIGYALVEVNCHSGLLAFSVLGVDAPVFFGLLVTLIAALVTVAAGGTALASAPDGLEARTAAPDAPEAVGRTRFMAYVGTWISGLFLLGILSSSAALLFLLPC